ncbi:hypothetical protein ACOMHN_038321 [Nucella lapillus]
MTPTVNPPPPSLGTALVNTTFWDVLPKGSKTCRTAVHQDTVVPPPKSKSILEAYLLAIPLGVLGAHHFYLGRIAFGIMYFLTFGLLGLGWLIDLLRLPCLVSSINKARREKYEQLQYLRQLQLQQWLQQEQQYGTAEAASMRAKTSVVFVPYDPISLVDAYVLWFPFGLLDAYVLWFPFGLLGYHHFYLRNYVMGVVYHFTFGLLGIGWLIDLFRMPSLVEMANSPRLRNEAKTYSQYTAHILAVTPTGIFGGHHFYLDRPWWGLLYYFTFGLMGVGWLFDWFRTSCLVKRANAVSQGEKSADRKYLDDAYILCFPFGFLGLHHFYLRRYCWGITYFLTLGIFGIGWVIDWFRLPWLLKEYHSQLEMYQRLTSTGNGNGSVGAASTSPLYPAPAAGYSSYHATAPHPPPPYPPPAGYPGNSCPATAPYPPPVGYHGDGYQASAPYLPPPAGYPGESYPTYVAQGYNDQGAAPPSYEATMNAQAGPNEMCTDSLSNKKTPDDPKL